MTPSWTPPDAEVVSLKEAAVRLGISPDAARKRLERSTLHGEKRGGRWRVFFVPDAEADAGQDATVDAIVDADRTTPDAAPDSASALIDALQSEVTYLRSALDAEMEARRRADHLVVGLRERLPELAATVEDAMKAPVGDIRPSVAPATHEAGLGHAGVGVAALVAADYSPRGSSSDPPCSAVCVIASSRSA